MAKLLYKGFSGVQFFLNLLFRAAILAAIVVVLSHYKENPVVIVIVAVFLTGILVLSGDDEILVYPDRVIQTDSSLASKIFKHRDGIYNIHDIRKASSQQDPDKKAIEDVSEGVMVTLLMFVLPRKKTVNTSNDRTFLLEMKNGETVTIHTVLESSKVEKIISLINSLV